MEDEERACEEAGWAGAVGTVDAGPWPISARPSPLGCSRRLAPTTRRARSVARKGCLREYPLGRRRDRPVLSSPPERLGDAGRTGPASTRTGAPCTAAPERLGDAGRPGPGRPRIDAATTVACLNGSGTMVATLLTAGADANVALPSGEGADDNVPHPVRRGDALPCVPRAGLHTKGHMRGQTVLTLSVPTPPSASSQFDATVQLPHRIVRVSSMADSLLSGTAPVPPSWVSTNSHRPVAEFG